jgi:hypothetical protein
MGNVSIYDLGELISKFNCQCFVETGTLYGEGVEYAGRFEFNKIISIEIEPDLAEDCRQRFLEDDRVTIITGDSSVEMKTALEMVDGPCIYWLDAHFPGGDRNDMMRRGYMEEESVDSRVPLLKEIEEIKKSDHFSKSVLLVDDARLFEKDNPNLDNHLKSIGQGTITRDTLCPYTSEDLINLVSDTHDVMRVDATGEGNYIITPKQKELE